MATLQLLEFRYVLSAKRDLIVQEEHKLLVGLTLTQIEGLHLAQLLLLATIKIQIRNQLEHLAV